MTVDSLANFIYDELGQLQANLADANLQPNVVQPPVTFEPAALPNRGSMQLRIFGAWVNPSAQLSSFNFASSVPLQVTYDFPTTSVGAGSIDLFRLATCSSLRAISAKAGCQTGI